MSLLISIINAEIMLQSCPKSMNLINDLKKYKHIINIKWHNISDHAH